MTELSNIINFKNDPFIFEPVHLGVGDEITNILLFIFVCLCLMAGIAFFSVKFVLSKKSKTQSSSKVFDFFDKKLIKFWTIIPLLVCFVVFGFCLFTNNYSTRIAYSDELLNLSDANVHVRDNGELRTDDFYLENNFTGYDFCLNNIDLNIYNGEILKDDCKITLFAEDNQVLFSGPLTQNITLDEPYVVSSNSVSWFFYTIDLDSNNAPKYVNESPIGFKFRGVTKEHVSTINVKFNASDNPIYTIYEKYGQGYYADINCTYSISSIGAPEKDNASFQGVYSQNVGHGDEIINKDGTITASNTYFTENSAYDIYMYFVFYVSAIELSNEPCSVSGDTESSNMFVYQKNNDAFYSDITLQNKISIIDNLPELKNKYFAGYYFIDDDCNERKLCDSDGNICIPPTTFTQEYYTSYAKWADSDEVLVNVDLSGATLRFQDQAPEGWTLSSENEYMYQKLYKTGEAIGDIVKEWDEAHVIAGADMLWSEDDGYVINNKTIQLHVELKDSLDLYDFNDLKAISVDISKNHHDSKCSTSLYYDKFVSFAENASLKKITGKNGKNMYIRIADINHDIIANDNNETKEFAGLTFITLNSFSNYFYYNDSSNNLSYKYNWKTSSLRRQLNYSGNEIFDFMHKAVDPDDVFIETVEKKYAQAWTPADSNDNSPSEVYSTKILECNDKYFVPSFKEITGNSGEWDNDLHKYVNFRGDEGEKYKYIQNNPWDVLTDWGYTNDCSYIDPTDTKWTDNPAPMMSSFFTESYDELMKIDPVTGLRVYETLDSSEDAMNLIYLNVHAGILEGQNNLFKHADWYNSWERSVCPTSPYASCVFRYNGYPNDNCSLSRKSSVVFMFCI